MNRTERLLLILIILLIIFSSIIFFTNKDAIFKNIEFFISKYKYNSLVIPYDKTIYHKNYELESVKEDYTFKPNNINDLKNIYYTVLNNGWNEFTFFCPDEYKSCTDDIKTITNDNDYLLLINNFVSPFNSYIKYNTLVRNDKEIYLSIDKLYSNNEINSINNELDRLFIELNINDSNTLKENIIKLHDYLIDIVTYDENYKENDITISNKANSALFNKIALCSGYTDALALMLDKLNVSNFKISSNDHIWNVVKYNNEWLHIDVTWDDDNRHNNNGYNFFMITTDELIKIDNGVHNFNRYNYKELK